jgi:hypothetical protein
MSKYWDERKELPYYKVARDLAERDQPASLLDVGAGETLYLNWYRAKKIAIVDLSLWDIFRELAFGSHDFSFYVGDFLKLEIPGKYEVVQSLQVLEHIPEDQRREFTEKLFTLATRAVVISIPYKWEAPEDHAGLDERSLFKYTGRRQPKEFAISSQRIIGRYEI